MSKKKFISNLSSVLADIRKLDAKKIVLDNKDILDHIKENVPTIKHSQDTRETVYENDLWGQYVETKDDGTIVIHDDWVTNPNASSLKAWNTSIVSVEDNKAYINDELYGNIQTEMIKDGSYMFYNTSLTSFSGDLSSLTNGGHMFDDCNFTTFDSDLSSLTNGKYMFNSCSFLTSFDNDLSSLTNGNYMFLNCSNLTSFNSNLSSLTDGDYMFTGTKLNSFNSDLSNLIYGNLMFKGCTSLNSFSMNLSSLIMGNSMFLNCTLLKSFIGDLNSITDGSYMFLNCSRLTSFSGDLSSLTNGDSMFQQTLLRSFSGDLSSLTNGYKMFYNANLTSFNSDLSNLTNGLDMFNYNNFLTSFSSNLSSLINGKDMFSSTLLNSQSVMYIVESIRNITEEKAKYPNEIPWVTYDSTTQKYSAPFGFMEDGRYVYTFDNYRPRTTTIPSSDVGKLTLCIHVTNDPDTIAQLLQTFAEECLYESWDKLVQAFEDKGWIVTFQYSGGDYVLD